VSDEPSWIRTVSETEATGRLAELYSRVVDPGTGQVDNIMKVHSLAPAGLSAHFELYKHVMTGSRTLPKVEREMIALVVSKLNGCEY
jgi:alkylhydroperoxidase family enzyme